VETAVRLKALVVDDDASIRKIVAKFLFMDGFDIVGEAADGAQALEIAATVLPDVITLDVSMPGMDGLAALPELRRALPGAVIVMLSMHIEHEKHALQRGADAYVLKTQAAHELIPAIRSACECSSAFSRQHQNELSLGSLQTRVEQAWRQYATLRHLSNEATELLIDLQGETPTPDGTFAAAESARLERATRVAMHDYFDAMAELSRVREHLSRK
jgi:DNA-binding NarL/FixJ family response regulator